MNDKRGFNNMTSVGLYGGLKETFSAANYIIFFRLIQTKLYLYYWTFESEKDLPIGYKNVT